MFDFRVGMVPKLPFHLAIQNNLELNIVIWVTFACQYPWDTVTHERSIDIKYWGKERRETHQEQTSTQSPPHCLDLYLNDQKTSHNF